MPRLSPLGRPILMGPGAGPLRCWLDLARTIEQICDAAGCRLVTHDVDTGEIRIVDQRGANWLVAGYGVWAARLQDGSGYRDSYGHTNPDWIPIGVDASGAILVADYPSGRGLWLVRPDGAADRIVDVLLDRTTDADLDAGVVVYRTGGDVVLWPTGEVFPAPIVDVRYSAGWLVGAGPGGLWLCSWARPERSWLLSTDGCDFSPDVQVLPGGQVVRVVSSRTAGEGDGDLRVYDVDVVRETISGVPAAPRDIRTYAPPVVDEPLVVIGRPVWLGWFEFSASEPGAVPPSSCVLPITQGAPWNTVVDLQGRPIARYTAGSPDSDMDSLDAAVRAAQAGSSLPVIGYWTRAAQTTGRVPASEIAGVEAYWHVNENEAAYESRLRSSVARCRRAALIVQVYTSNATNIQDLTRIPAPVSRVARDCPQVEMILGFSGSGRATGYQDHPEVWPLWAAVFAGIPGVPPLPRPVPDPATPLPADPEDPMTARLPKSRLTPSRTFPGRWLYRLSSGNYLSLDGSTGAFRPGGTRTDGDSEAFEWDGRSDHCDITPGNADGVRFAFGVDLSR